MGRALGVLVASWAVACGSTAYGAQCNELVSDRSRYAVEESVTRALCLYHAESERLDVEVALTVVEGNLARYRAAWDRLSDSTRALAAVLEVGTVFSEEGFRQYLYGSGGLAWSDKTRFEGGHYGARIETGDVRSAVSSGLALVAPLEALSDPSVVLRAPGGDRFIEAIRDLEGRRVAKRFRDPLGRSELRPLMGRVATAIPPHEGRFDRGDPENAARAAMRLAAHRVLENARRYLVPGRAGRRGEEVPRRQQCALRGYPVSETGPDRMFCNWSQPLGIASPKIWLNRFKQERFLACWTESVPVAGEAPEPPWLVPRCPGPIEAFRDRIAQGREPQWRAERGHDRTYRDRLRVSQAALPSPDRLPSEIDRLRGLARKDGSGGNDHALCLAAVLDRCRSGDDIPFLTHAPWRTPAHRRPACASQALSEAKPCASFR